MKALKIIIPVAGLLLASAPANSQVSGNQTPSELMYQANRLAGSDLNGTARFVGMGGAMGALGGDITTMGTNPAGIGIFRSSDMNISFGFSNVGNKATYNGLTRKNDEFFGSFDNVGFVLALKQGNHTPVRFVNFGFNYNKLKSFDRNSIISGDYDVSQTQQFAAMANGINPNSLLAAGAYDDRNIPWLAIMAHDSYLIESNGDANNTYGTYFRPLTNLVLGDYTSQERGAIHSYNFNIALNLYDRFYIGGTVGVYDVDYRKTSTYSEDFADREDISKSEGYYELTNHYSLDGTGFDFKLGAIWRPFESSPFRVGAAVHTPVFYNLTARNRSYTYYEVEILNEDNLYEFIDGGTNPQDASGYEMTLHDEYKLRTPWKYNFSLGYTIGSSIAIGAEYEYADYSSSKYKTTGGIEIEGENKSISNMLKGVNTFRIGAEFKVAPQFSVRAGYNHITASTETNAYRAMDNASVLTDTDYANTRATNNYTLGLGFRGEHFYADMAYQYNNYKEHFYAFRNASLRATDVTNNRHQVLFTLGMRF